MKLHPIKAAQQSIVDKIYIPKSAREKGIKVVKTKSGIKITNTYKK